MSKLVDESNQLNVDKNSIDDNDMNNTDSLLNTFQENNNSKDNSVREDHEFAQKFVPSAAILTTTNEFTAVVIMRTPYARVQLRLQYLPNYPFELPIVELSSPTLPMPLLRNKEKECLDVAQKEAIEGKPQFQVIYDFVYAFIHTNLFIPCWKEMKQVATLCANKGSLSVVDKEGLIRMKLQCGQYKQVIHLRIPLLYPEQGVEIEFISSNYPSQIQYMFKSQAEEIVRRCEAGFTAEQALSGSNPIKLPVKPTNEVKAVKVTTSTIKNLKHDVTVLKQISDLREASTAKGSKDQYFTQVNAERRAARKDLRKLACAESEADEAEYKRLLEMEQNEMKEMMKAKISDTAQLSLYPVARFLVDDYICRLPREQCQACKMNIFPENPDNEAITNSNSTKRPMRTFCGHWLHHNCLDEWLTTPPFIRQCPICDRRIWHPDWPEDHKQLEKAWQNKEARKREVSDVSDFMGMGDEFLTTAAKNASKSAK
eukprot:gene6293-8667_t